MTGKSKTLVTRDDPLSRFKASVVDKLIGSEDRLLAEKRFIAIKEARGMVAASENDPANTKSFSSQWVQLGPTSIPGGAPYGNLNSPWKPIHVSGRVTSIIADPKSSDTLYIGTPQGGIWKTTNAGKEWIAISDRECSLAIGALAIDERNPSILYAGTGEANGGPPEASQYGMGILKTTDGGQTWQQPTRPDRGKDYFHDCRFYRLAINSHTSNTLFAAVSSESTDPKQAGRMWEPDHENNNIQSGIYRSIDGGNNWIRMEGGLPSLLGPSVYATDVVLDPSNPDVAYAAFWRYGIYKTTEANTHNPNWTLLTGLPNSPSGTANFARIALGISKSSPSILYTLMCENDHPQYTINKFFQTKDGGNSWHNIEIEVDVGLLNGNHDFGIQGNYNLNLAVHPMNPNVVYIGGVSLWKAIYDPDVDKWNFTHIGQDIHQDHHSFAFSSSNPEVIYAGNDGGIYKSEDGGNNWDDKINKGLCIAQFESMEQYPNDDKIIFAGVQDNGTLRYVGNPEFDLVEDGDGGFVCIDPSNANNIWHTNWYLSPRFTYQGLKTLGKDGLSDIDWIPLGLSPIDQISNSDFKIKSLFYPPLTLDKTNPKNIAMGGSELLLHTVGLWYEGRDTWQYRIPLPARNDLDEGEIELISAIDYVNWGLIYLGTNYGGVYRVTYDGKHWTPEPIYFDGFPKRYVTDVSAIPNNNPDGEPTVIVTLSGFDAPHVWKRTTNNSEAKWEAIGPDGTGTPPEKHNIPFNAVVVDSTKPDTSTIYVGADIGVYRTVDGGKTWITFNDGLPNCQVYDMRLSKTGLLRIVTHGRGMWQRKVA